MALEQVAASMERVVSALRRKPYAGLHDDTPATVRWAGGLRAVTHSVTGVEISTDMPAAIGGEDSAATPGWLLRTALASCAVTRIAMEAAARGIALVEATPGCSPLTCALEQPLAVGLHVEVAEGVVD